MSSSVLVSIFFNFLFLLYFYADQAEIIDVTKKLQETKDLTEKNNALAIHVRKNS